MPAVNCANTDGTSVTNKGFEKSQRVGFYSLHSCCGIIDSSRVQQMPYLLSVYLCTVYVCVPHLQRLINPSCCR